MSKSFSLYSTNKPLISIVILAGPHRQNELVRCLKSIMKSSYQTFEIILVDNSLNPKLTPTIHKKFPYVRIYKMPENVGLLGYNIGFSNAKGQYIFAVDDDTTIKYDVLEKIVELVKTLPSKVGIIAANMYQPVEKLFFFQNYINLHISLVPVFDGAGVIFKKEVFEKVGYYDEDFFMWVNELDYSLRVLSKGYLIYFAQNIQVNHYKKSSLRALSVFFTFRNIVKFNIKHFSFFLLPLLFLKNIFSILVLGFKSKSFSIWIAGVKGIIIGYITCYLSFKKREPVSFLIQVKYLKFYLFNLQK